MNDSSEDQRGPMGLKFQAARDGDLRASERLLPVVYVELRRLAQTLMDGERPVQTREAAALVHEVCTRLVGGARRTSWEVRGRIFNPAVLVVRPTGRAP